MSYWVLVGVNGVQAAAIVAFVVRELWRARRRRDPF